MKPLNILFLVYFLMSICLFSSCNTSYTTTAVGLDKKDYLQERKSLIQKDSLYSFEAEISLTPQEELLDQKLRTLQWEMLQDYKDNHFFPPARNFYNSKSHISQTKLFKILRKMPKGGILHLHHAAAGNADWFVDKMISLPEAYVYWGVNNESYIKGQMAAFNAEDAPEGFYPAQNLADQVPNFKDSLKSMITFDESIDADSVDIWQHFEFVFQRIYGILGYRPFMQAYLQASVDSLVADRIQHVEARMGLEKLRYYDLTQPEGFPIDTFIADVYSIRAHTRKKDPAFSLSVIQANLRFRDKRDIWLDIQNTYQLRKKYPDLIKGYDLVAEEDAGHTTLYFLENWLRMDSLERVYGIDLPLYLHDGESNWVSVENLYDAVLLNSKRVGHGFNLFRFPSLIEEVKAKDICIEISPLSNQILGYIRDLRMHPGSYIMRQGVQCVISSDDPLIFDYSGLSYDFWSVFLAWELDLRGLKQLCRNSLTYSALEEGEKQEALRVWEERWEAFVREALDGF